MARKQSEVCYTRSTLAELLEITPEEAQELMEREDFPATRITGQRVEGVNDNFSITL